MTTANSISVKPASGINARMSIPGDKSVSHRSIIFGALAKGTTKVSNFLEAEDCLNTIECFRNMGINIVNDKRKKTLLVEGQGLYTLKKPDKTLYVGNSGTSIRLLLGVLAAQKFDSEITGDASICRRPMGRVIDPLTKMGARFEPVRSGEKVLAPVKIYGNQHIRSLNYKMPMASAQVKSAILLAGLYTAEKVTIVEPGPARDHTERMMKKFGINIIRSKNMIEMIGAINFKGQTIEVPSDISSAAFFIVAGLIVPDSTIVFKNIGMNPTRTGILDVLKEMGGKIKISNLRNQDFEPIADIEVISSALKGIKINGDIIPRIIDEIPIIAVAAAVASGETVISGAEELRHKESDRISTICRELSKFGVDIKEEPDGMRIRGTENISGAQCESNCDHRIAMSSAILGLVAKGETIINDVECINTSFPEFFDLFKSLR